MNSVNLLLTFTILAALAAISPPAISYYYADNSSLTASLGYSPDLAAN